MTLSDLIEQGIALIPVECSHNYFQIDPRTGYIRAADALGSAAFVVGFDGLHNTDDYDQFIRHLKKEYGIDLNQKLVSPRDGCETELHLLLPELTDECEGWTRQRIVAWLRQNNL